MFSALYKNKNHGTTSLLSTLQEHKGPIMAMAISPDGKLLAAGGIDGLFVWDLSAKKSIDIPQLPFYERCQVSCICWFGATSDGASDTLAYGNAVGFLVFLQRRSDEEDSLKVIHSTRIARGEEILHIAATSNDGLDRIVVGTRDNCVQIWNFDRVRCTLTAIHSKAYDKSQDIIPKVLAFDQNLDLFVFGLYDGGLYKYSSVDMKTKVQHRLRSQIGNAAVELDKRLCVVDNVGNGFDLYNLDTAEFIRTFPTRDPKETYPKGVAFVDHSRAVIGGSDHGLVYIFQRRTGRVIDTLRYQRKGGVETLAVHDCQDGSVLIAAASASLSDRRCPVKVWTWKPNRKPKKNDERAINAPIRVIMRFIAIVVLLMIIGYYAAQHVHVEKATIMTKGDNENVPLGFTITLGRPFRQTVAEASASLDGQFAE